MSGHSWDTNCLAKSISSLDVVQAGEASPTLTLGFAVGFKTASASSPEGDLWGLRQSRHKHTCCSSASSHKKMALFSETGTLNPA